MKNNIFTGIILIFIGILILLHQIGIDVFSTGILKSIGLLLIGSYLFTRGVRSRATGLSYLGFFLFFVGIYYALAEFRIVWPNRGLNLSVFTIIAGLSFYLNYLFNRKNLTQLLAGNVLIIVGIFFFLHYLGKIPTAVFVAIVDRYWPLLLIIVGVGLVIQAFFHRNDKTGEVKDSV